ncbi:polymorphic toxin type 50 domain-containing protein [Companilactobacillus huachuanensis]|uniref:Polymorphic toxin type 50 domain-containing protein n=1 Tax=Companilactobacillus huachuanensis TaxID=2559914 RepID=A0ABW1RNX6_9LACO
MEYKLGNGRRKNIEIVNTNDFFCTAVSMNGEQTTSTFKIHHSKQRTHVVPIKRRE